MTITLSPDPVEATVATPVWHRVDVEPPARAAVRSAASTPEGRLGRAFVKGTLVGTLIVFLFCGGISLLAGLPLAGAFAIGAFTAFWGGPGFGGMMGATVYYSFHSDEF